ncbi:subtilisin-like protein [Trametes versicolor FP-101664 SS1]|uniref:subtilisin-like protein n=1 Tax=Trametes versicolor (strain FP-101664) TaxID=717944 RepID=UPI000462260C|nr:subtilisin-like protein [Trametes versicolor FP-101664 SS1]EIW61085.1 subtilisin-like protein [Trametes versicolor FP-101664 SS1]
MSACAGVASSAVASTLQLHEARRGIPAGFSIHGAAAPDTVLNLRMALVQSNFAGLEERLYDVSTPSSANYGKHLSKAEVEQYVAPKQDSVTAVNAWLAANGLSGTPISPAGDWIAVQVPVSKANKLLGAQFSVFQDDATGRQVIRTLSYSIPAELKDHLDLVHPTITFADIKPLVPVVSAHREARVPVDSALVANAVPTTCDVDITPACLQDLYGIPSTPATQSSNQLGVSGFIDQFANQADLETFLTKFRPDVSNSTTFNLKALDGGQNPQDPSDAGIEANLDTQYTVGIATAVNTTFFSVGDSTKDGIFGFLDLINSLLAEPAPPQVLTTSYGADEGALSQNLVRNLCQAYAQLGARGTSILFSSGDGGVSGSQAKGCVQFVPTFPSGCPFLTSVGATQLTTTSGLTIETAAEFSSGGFSNFFPTPAYQQAVVDTYINKTLANGTVNEGLFNASGRAFPDVSAAGVDYLIVVSGDTDIVSGTSASSPLFASVIALINDRLASKGKPPLGFLNPFLYSEAGASALNDVTEGSNPGCGSQGFPAAQGWDPVTGLGTPNFAKLLAAALDLP